MSAPGFAGAGTEADEVVGRQAEAHAEEAELARGRAAEAVERALREDDADADEIAEKTAAAAADPSLTLYDVTLRECIEAMGADEYALMLPMADRDEETEQQAAWLYKTAKEAFARMDSDGDGLITL